MIHLNDSSDWLINITYRTDDIRLTYILALSYMEANPGDFPMSNVNSALQKISQSITPEALEKVMIPQPNA